MSESKKRPPRESVRDEETEFFGEDDVLRIVREHVERTRPGRTVKVVRHTLDGVAVEHSGKWAAAPAEAA